MFRHSTYYSESIRNLCTMGACEDVSCISNPYFRWNVFEFRVVLIERMDFRNNANEWWWWRMSKSRFNWERMCRARWYTIQLAKNDSGNEKGQINMNKYLSKCCSSSSVCVQILWLAERHRRKLIALTHRKYSTQFMRNLFSTFELRCPSWDYKLSNFYAFIVE